MPQKKLSIPSEEWNLIQDYYEANKEQLKLEGIRSPTMLLRRWVLDRYRENITQKSNKQ
ncbi:MAG: hypothetical protein ACQCN6_02545 [Candidatus Bathyarchaeia archaeon]